MIAGKMLQDLELPNQKARGRYYLNSSSDRRNKLTNYGRFLSLHGIYPCHGGLAGIGRGNRLQIAGIIAEALFSLEMFPLFLFDTLQFLTELAVGTDAIAVADEGEWDNRNAQAEECD